MKECIIVGRPNVGKTLFALNFASYLNTKEIDMIFRHYDGIVTCRHLAINTAKQELCSLSEHTTKQLQSMSLRVPIGKGTVNFNLTDTCGVTEDINSDEAIRKAMAQTLSALRSSHFIFHVIDMSQAIQEIDAEDIDYEIYRYGIAKKIYVVLANKMDTQDAAKNLTVLKRYYTQAIILPISALNSQGFKEVKQYVARNI